MTSTNRIGQLAYAIHQLHGQRCCPRFIMDIAGFEVQVYTTKAIKQSDNPFFLVEQKLQSMANFTKRTQALNPKCSEILLRYYKAKASTLKPNSL